MQWTSTCTFTHIVLTAPTEKIASIYRKQLRHLQESFEPLSQCKIFCVADPPQARVGSGGGTFNALSALAHGFGEQLDSLSKVLIVHSGGDSKRAPLHSLCGKAWMSLNIALDNTIASPLLLLILEANALLGMVSPPFVAVGCGDVLLRLTPTGEALDDCLSSGVYVVTVRAPIQTATNHGVIVASVPNSSEENSVCDVSSYLQKPSIKEMVEKNAVISSPANDSSEALIDTGLVVFYGSAVATLKELALDGDRFNCSTQSLSESPTREPLRFELYSELLMACRCDSILSREDYLEKIGIVGSLATDYGAAMSHLHEQFASSLLRTIFCQNGQFIHLGTSRELVATCCGEGPRQPANFPFIKSVKSSTPPSVRSVVVNSIVDTSAVHANDSGSGVIEHCGLWKCELPRNAVLSHVGPQTCVFLDSCLSNCLIQHVFLQSDRLGIAAAMKGHSLRTMITLHIDDNPKLDCRAPNATVLGVPWEVLCSALEISHQDIFALSSSDQSLWNAKLFPVFYFDEKDILQFVSTSGESIQATADLLAWPRFVLRPDSCAGRKLGSQWKSLLRISLSDIIEIGSAEAMFTWRVLVSAAQLTSPPESLLSSLEAIHHHWMKACNSTSASEIDSDVTAVVSLLVLIVQSLVHPSCDIIQLVKTLIGGALPREALTSLITMESVILRSTALVNQLRDSIDAGSMAVFMRFLIGILPGTDLTWIIRTMLSPVLLGLIPLRSHPRFLLLLSILANNTRGGDATNESVWDWASCAYTPNDIDNSDLQRKLWEHSKAVAKELQSTFANNSSTNFGEACHSGARELILTAIQLSNDCVVQLSHHRPPYQLSGKIGRCAMANAPARIDLAGGWSDTPPICYDMGGAVLNVAVRVDGQRPLGSFARCTESRSIRVLIFGRNGAGELFEVAAEEYHSSQDFLQVAHSDSPCALVKACLVVLGVISCTSGGSLSDVLDRSIGCGLEIAACSTLPAGSGMGGSSILAATVLQAVASALSFPLPVELVTVLVSQVEQVLQTCGGWQDQVGGCFAGFKIARSSAKLPLIVNVEPVRCAKQFEELFNRRTILLYTGHQRLAKNTLLNALELYAMMGSQAAMQSSTVQQLRANAEQGFRLLSDEEAGNEAKFQSLGSVLSEYWNLKIAMASGSNPPRTQRILNATSGLTAGQSLCGAGAGGFAVLMLADEGGIAKVAEVVQQLNQAANQDPDAAETEKSQMSIHSVQVDNAGLACMVEERCEDDNSSLLVRLLSM